LEYSTHLVPRATNPAAINPAAINPAAINPATTNPAATDLETRSYHPALPILPLPISQLAATCRAFNCDHILIGIFLAPRASHYQSRRNQFRHYQSRNSQLPPHATNPAATNLAIRNYLLYFQLCPYPNRNIPRTSSLALPIPPLSIPPQPIPPLPISKFAATTPCYQSRPYQSRNSQLPAALKFVSIPNLEYSSHVPPRAYQRAGTSSRLPTRGIHLAATGCRLLNRDSPLPARAIHPAATGCHPYQLVLTAL
jgi:hypothetical protein